VQKTLDMNHLESLNAKELKKGFPVILPSKDENHKERTFTNYKIINKTKYLREKNTYISKHQEVFIYTGISSQNGEVSNKSVYTSESPNISLSVIGRNNNKMNDMFYNFEGELSYTNSRTAKYDFSDDVLLKPTYGLRTSVRLNKESIPFDFGMTYQIEESSFVSFDTELTTRRDRNHWLGFKINKETSFFNNQMSHRLIYEKNLIQSPLTEGARYEASRISLRSNSRITKNLFFGPHMQWTNFESSELGDYSQFGFNLSYKIH
jgi:hypothetical protein